MNESGTIVLKPGKEGSVRRYHPWIFSGALEEIDGNTDDAGVADVFDWEKHWIARGLFSPKSQIRVRLLTRQKEESLVISSGCSVFITVQYSPVFGLDDAAAFVCTCQGESKADISAAAALQQVGSILRRGEFKLLIAVPLQSSTRVVVARSVEELSLADDDGAGVCRAIESDCNHDVTLKVRIIEFKIAGTYSIRSRFCDLKDLAADRATSG